MGRVLLIILIFTLSTFQGISQCLVNVDFNTWSVAGNPANGNWSAINGGSEVKQSNNGLNTFFISPFELINVRISGEFYSTHADDDWMGFVFSFQDPIGNSNNYDCWLVDWKAQAQGNAPRGMALCKLDGVITNESATFGDHIDMPPEFTVVQNTFGGAGWQRNVPNSFTLELTFTRATIYIDGNMVFDVEDCFQPGYFGFYNRSQPNCYYRNFQYDLFIDFVVETPTVCPGDPAEFTFYNSGCTQSGFDFSQYASLTWDFGDNTTVVNNNPTAQNVNPTHIYTAPGNYTVSLTITDIQGCSATKSYPVTVLAPPTIDFTADIACEGSPTNFTNLTGGNPTFWEWQFEVGQPLDNTRDPSYTFPDAGTYTVTLTASENGCLASETRDVTVAPSPTAAFSAASIPCSGLPVDLTDESTSDPNNAITNWDWDFDGDNVIDATTPNAVAVFPTPGTYNVSLTVTTTNGCSDTYTEQVSVTESPVVDFTWTDACLNDGIAFDATASVNGGNITDYYWDYDGDQVPDDIIEDPTHVFSTPGQHQVSLAVMADNGCPNYAQHDVNVFAEPTAAFDFVNACAGENIVFTDQSTVLMGNIVSWDWDFESDNVIDDNTQNPSYDYGGTASQYDVTLTVTTDMGCTHSVTQTIEVYPNPSANFTFNDVCYGTTANFIDVSTVATGNVTAWSWDLGLPGATSIQQNPNYDYPAANTYTVTLIATTDNGCTATTNKDITIFPVPEADFTNSTECFTDATQFYDATIVTPPSNITNWAWTFGDPPAQNVQDPSHTYSAPGTYNVSLTVTSNNGCTNTTSEQVVVHPLPEPDFTATSVCLGEPTVFTDLSGILPPGSIDSWYWDFDDQNNTTQSAPSHTYAAAGFYDVNLTLTSYDGCTDQITHQVEVYPLPSVDFVATETEGCQPFVTNFIDQSTIPAGYSIVKWQWELGNGTSNAQHPKNPYPLDSTYTIALTATSGEGCQSTLTLTDYITVWPKPKAGFEATPQPTDIIFPHVTFNNLASDDVIDWMYFFGDGSQSGEETPRHTYVTHGTYDIEQWVYNQYGCGDTITDIVIIEPAYTLYIPNAFTPNEDGHNDEFLVKGLEIGIIQFRMRVFNRWGEQLFESRDINKGWDGTIRGGIDQVPNGTYLYRIDIINLEGDEKHYNGKVAILR